MEGETPTGTAQGDVAVSDVPPMRDLAFSMLSLLIDAAAWQLRADASRAASSEKSARGASLSPMREARAAIDAANALLSAVREVLEIDALRALEGTLMQLQIEYVSRAGRVT